MFERFCNDEYTVKLENPGHLSTQGALVDVDPGGSADLIAQIYDQRNNKVFDKTVRLVVAVNPGSGGHAHLPDRPTGIVPATVTSGATFAFGAPIVAGDHTITATCVEVACGSDTGKVWVGIKDLQPLRTDPNYVLIPNADQKHPSNHYVTETTQRKISKLAAYYHQTFPNDPPLYLNDASLVRGGLFDLAANWSSSPRGHSTHRFGTDIDVRANEFYHNPLESIPVSNYVDLMNTIAPRHGCNAQIHSGATQNEHFHFYCR